MAKKGGPPIKTVDWELFDSLCEIQCTQSEIANCLKMSTDTLHTRVMEAKGMPFSAYYEQKKDIGKKSLRRKMFEVAQSGNCTMLIWLSKNWLNFTDKTEDVTPENKDKNIAIKELSQKLLSLTHIKHEK